MSFLDEDIKAIAEKERKLRKGRLIIFGLLFSINIILLVRAVVLIFFLIHGWLSIFFICS